MRVKYNSILISKLTTILLFFAIIVSTPFLPSLLSSYKDTLGKNKFILDSLLLTFYITIPSALVLLYCLYRLLSNIDHSNVFTEKNLQLLKISSYCCFFAAIVYLFFAKYYLFALLISVVVILGGLILQVIQNVLLQAIILKTENDFTI